MRIIESFRSCVLTAGLIPTCKATDVSGMALIRRYWACESGATAIEYGLIVGIISTVVMAIAATGGAVEALYNTMMQIAESIS